MSLEEMVLYNKKDDEHLFMSCEAPLHIDYFAF